MIKAEVLSMKLTEKISNALKSKATWVKVSISFFITGLFFFVVSIVFPSNNDNMETTVISTLLMLIALFIFPYFDKDKLCAFLSIFCFYILFLFVTLFVVLYWITNIIKQTQNTWFSIAAAIMITTLIYMTLHILSLAVRKIKEMLSKLPKASRGTKKAQTFKKTFTNIGVITSFIIALLTIIKTLSEIISPFLAP